MTVIVQSRFYLGTLVYIILCATILSLVTRQWALGRSDEGVGIKIRQQIVP